jgi:hypothetical protein
LPFFEVAWSVAGLNTGAYPETDESSSYTHIPLLYDHFNIILPPAGVSLKGILPQFTFLCSSVHGKYYIYSVLIFSKNPITTLAF